MQVKSIEECNTSTVIKLPIFIKIFVLSIFEWPFYTDFTVQLRKDWSIENTVNAEFFARVLISQSKVS